ncbi:putative exocyst complex protein exo70-like [Capsicum annuum]|nr:putative exocyst complex protein exo70-like [Capsicum annuum]
MNTQFCSRYSSLNFTPIFPSLAPAIQLTNLRRRYAVVTSRMDSTTTVSATASGGDNSTEENSVTDTVIQYVVLRRDLIDTWPLGSVVTQGCHAAVAAIWSHKDDDVTLQYCSPSNIDSMHKVTLEVKGETQILNLAEKLKAGGIAHKLWIEQPENIPTCLAIKPYPKSLYVQNLPQPSWLRSPVSQVPSQILLGNWPEAQVSFSISCLS